MIGASEANGPPPLPETMIAAFTAKANTLDSNGLRTLYTQLWNLEGGAPFQMLDIVLHLLMTRDGVEATEAFVDTLD